MVGSGGSEVPCQLSKPEVAISTPAGDDRFSGCEYHRHACHMIMWHVVPIEYQFDSGTLCKTKSREYLATDERLNRIKFKRHNFVAEAATGWMHQ
ncbi:hypothetical protein TNCV_3582581 [Trichonephila clavipes]|nr:hypothetical protein TNCV_3582581 [Trichonephila clavipes]